MTVYVMSEGRVVSGVFGTLDVAQAAAPPSATGWQSLPSVKGSRPYWWRAGRETVIEAFEVQP